LSELLRQKGGRIKLQNGKIFIVYPSFPDQIERTINALLKKMESRPYGFNLQAWRQLDIPGRFIVEKVLEEIAEAKALIADITYLNFNVTFEVGFALGCGKRVLPVLNNALSPQVKEINQLGIFDTIGYQAYTNTDELAKCISGIKDFTTTRFPNYTIDKGAPV
jgi:hypothetical protein